MLVIGVVMAVAVIAVTAAVLLSSRPVVNYDVDYSTIPQSRTDDGAFVLGNPEAPITIVEFADFLCPHCQGYEPTIARFIEDYVVTGQAMLEYRMLPAVDAVFSPIAAGLAECAAEIRPGSFWDAHNTLFSIATSSRFDGDSPRTFSDRMGISYTQLFDCLETASQFETDQALATASGVQGTPAVMVRYNGGDLEWVNFAGQEITRGAVDYEILAFIVEEANLSSES